jgi:MoaA/NifB/PqqE/SkfB family radical SAM enzyme
MKKGLLSRLFPKKRKRAFFAWQVELTTRCPLLCAMCVRCSGKDWLTKDMDIADFRKIARYFGEVESVVLEGWGEPLLYKDLIEAVSLVKQAGAQPGFITSGWGLTRDYSSRLLDAGIGFIGFSVSGGAKDTHEAIRKNSDFDKLIESIHCMAALKRDKRLDSPRIHIVYLMLRSNIAEIPALLDIAAGIGAQGVVAINLALAGSSWQDEQKVFGSGDPEFVEILREAQEKASRLGIGFRSSPLASAAIDVCEENPLANLYISVEGEVSPCVYLNPPVTASPHRVFFCGRETMVEKVGFGNILREPFEKIWESKDYLEFRNCWAKRKRSSWAAMCSPLSWPSECRREAVSFPDPPLPCRTCHRSLGY